MRRALWLVTALHVGLLLGYSFIVPTFRAPDEYVHVDLVREVAQHHRYPEYDQRHVAAPVIAARDTSRVYDSFAPAQPEAAAVPRGHRPAFSDLGPDEPTTAVNPLPEHPPLYYALGAAVYDLAGDHLAFDRHVWLLRLLSVVLVAPLPLLAWAAARRLGAGPPVALTAAALLVAIPGFTHIGSVVNNDNLLVLLGGVLTLLVVRAVTGDARHRTAVAAGVVCGLALLTKGFALALVPWAAGAYLLARHTGWRTRLSRAAEVAAVATAVGGWWWINNVVAYGRLQPSVNERPPAPEPVQADVIEFTRHFAARLFGSFWGSFGWREADLPWPAIAIPSLLVAATLVIAVVAARSWRDRAVLALLLFPSGALLAGVAANAWRAYLKTGTPYASQGRYLYAGLAALVVVAAIGLATVARRGGRNLPMLVLLAAVLMHGLAWVAIVTRYYAGHGPIERLQAMFAFSPWPPAAFGAIVGATAALAAFAVVEAGRLARQREH